MITKKTNKTTTPRKRKIDGDAHDDGSLTASASPTKKGQITKAEGNSDEGDLVMIKTEDMGISIGGIAADVEDDTNEGTEE